MNLRTRIREAFFALINRSRVGMCGVTVRDCRITVSSNPDKPGITIFSNAQDSIAIRDCKIIDSGIPGISLEEDKE